MRKVALAVVAMVFGWSSGAGATPVITNGLVAAWEFSGNANDLSGNSNHGTVIGATLTADRFGNPDSAYLFDSDIDRIEISPVFSGDQDPLTFAAWINIEESGYSVYGEYLSAGWARNQFSVWAGGLTLSQYPPSGGPQIEGLSINPQEWVHVALTKEADVLSAYVNGSFAASAPHTETYSGPTPQVAAIGNQISNGVWGFAHYNFDGKIDDLLIYNRALSPSEVQTLYSAVPEPSTALLLGLGLVGMAGYGRL